MDLIVNQYSQEIIKKGKKKIPEEMLMISFFDRFGWDYQKYINTPPYIIDLILAKDEIDNKLNKLKNGNK